jgi:hypothetical protein
MKKKKVVLVIAVTTAFVVLSLYAEQNYKQLTASPASHPAHQFRTLVI